PVLVIPVAEDDVAELVGNDDKARAVEEAAMRGFGDVHLAGAKAHGDVVGLQQQVGVVVGDGDGGGAAAGCEVGSAAELAGAGEVDHAALGSIDVAEVDDAVPDRGGEVDQARDGGTVGGGDGRGPAAVGVDGVADAAEAAAEGAVSVEGDGIEVRCRAGEVHVGRAADQRSVAQRNLVPGVDRTAVADARVEIEVEVAAGE